MPFSACDTALRSPHPPPPRRSSDLGSQRARVCSSAVVRPTRFPKLQRLAHTFSGSSLGRPISSDRRNQKRAEPRAARAASGECSATDRKSTRLNSSHMSSSYAVFCMRHRPPQSPPSPSTTLFRSRLATRARLLQCGSKTYTIPEVAALGAHLQRLLAGSPDLVRSPESKKGRAKGGTGSKRGMFGNRSEEHTSELQSHVKLVCRFLHATPPSAVPTLPLHDALPISARNARASAPVR